MNRQYKGPKRRGIEWTDFSWNPVAGCQHGCEWVMPDGAVAECYAKTIADKLRAPTFMPNGFEAHEFHPERLEGPLKLKQPARIFIDSMSDLMGHWVPDEQSEQVLEVCRQAHWHTFQLLTKNAPRLLKFDFPPNVWLGVSSPPSVMFGKPLSHPQQYAYVKRAMDVLNDPKVAGRNLRWMSAEPVIGGLSDMLWACEGNLDWLVIGAASNGPRIYQPDADVVRDLIRWADCFGSAVFFKGNLRGNRAANPWREEFPSHCGNMVR